MKRLNVAIIGCGRVSVCYEAAFLRLSAYVHVCCAVDSCLEKAKEFGDKFQCAYTDQFEDILSMGIDVVHLCLPHHLHPELAVKAMEAGIHVLTEKPMAITLQDADRMLAVQKKTGVRLGCIFQTRYVKGVELLRQIVREERFGKALGARSCLTWSRPYSYYEGSDWKGTWDMEGGGVLIDQAIHSIDRVRFILGSDVEWIDGSVHNRFHHSRTGDGREILVEDSAEAAVQFKNGCIYNLYACNYYTWDAPITLEIQCERGRLGMIQDMGYICSDGCRTEIRNAYETETVGPDYWGSSHHMQLKDFYESILYNRPVAVDGLEGRKTLEIVKGIYLSSLKKERIILPFEDIKYSRIPR